MEVVIEGVELVTGDTSVMLDLSNEEELTEKFIVDDMLTELGAVL